MTSGPRLLAILFFASLPVLLAPAAFGAGNASRVDRQVIVEWKPGVTAAQKANALARVTVASLDQLNANGAAPVDAVDVGSTTSRSGAIATLAASPYVAAVEPDRPLHRGGKVDLSRIFNDPLVVDGTQWHVLGSETTPGNEYGVDAVSAWREGIYGDPNTYVGVIDEGVDINQPDLRANVFTNPWDPPNGIDDDHNGFVDDVHGWDFYNNDNTVYDGTDPFDFIDAHGTIVAGEIAASLGNRTGGAGVAPRAKVIPAKFLGQDGGDTADAIRALDYLTDLKVRHHLNIVATNNSYEGDDTDSHALRAAIQRGADARIIFVTIAGNGDENGNGYSIDRTPNYPASLRCELPSGSDCMIVTTAINKKGNLPHFANWGKSTVDLGAPGVLVTSTFPGDNYLAYDGTSQAAPLVAGALALYMSRYPWASPTRARHALLQSVARTPSLIGKTRTGGRLDIDAMLDNNQDSWSGDGWWHDGRED